MLEKNDDILLPLQCNRARRSDADTVSSMPWASMRALQHYDEGMHRADYEVNRASIANADFETDDHPSDGVMVRPISGGHNVLDG